MQFRDFSPGTYSGPGIKLAARISEQGTIMIGWVGSARKGGCECGVAWREAAAAAAAAATATIAGVGVLFLACGLSLPGVAAWADTPMDPPAEPGPEPAPGEASGLGVSCPSGRRELQ